MEEQSFLGIGWNFPPIFLGNGADVQMVTREEDIRQSLIILLQTRLKEREMCPNYGCDISQFLFEEVDQNLSTQISSCIRDAIFYHEARIKVEDIKVDTHADEPGLLMVSVYYMIKSTNSRYNLVFPFYLNEAAVPI